MKRFVRHVPLVAALAVLCCTAARSDAGMVLTTPTPASGSQTITYASWFQDQPAGAVQALGADASGLVFLSPSDQGVDGPGFGADALPVSEVNLATGTQSLIGAPGVRDDFVTHIAALGSIRQLEHLLPFPVHLDYFVMGAPPVSKLVLVAPEPATLVSLGTGAVCLLGYARRRRQAARQ